MPALFGTLPYRRPHCASLQAVGRVEPFNRPPQLAWRNWFLETYMTTLFAIFGGILAFAVIAYLMVRS